MEEEACPSCFGVGTIVCINCKGDGLAIPVMLDKKVSRDPVSEGREGGKRGVGGWTAMLEAKKAKRANQLILPLTLHTHTQGIAAGRIRYGVMG